MRTIEEIKADMEEAIEKYDTDRMNDLYKEKALYYIRDIQVDRLEQICTAEREGRLVVLPCKVGDTIYVVRDKKVCEFVVDCIKKFDKDLTLHGYLYGYYRGGVPTEYTLGEYTIGKTVFLDKSQAEAALKGERK